MAGAGDAGAQKCARIQRTAGIEFYRGAKWQTLAGDFARWGSGIQVKTVWPLRRCSGIVGADSAQGSERQSAGWLGHQSRAIHQTIVELKVQARVPKFEVSICSTRTVSYTHLTLPTNRE